MPGMALKEATPSDGTKAPLAMGPPKSKVVVPIPQKTGVLAAMTRLAGYDVTPELDVRSKKEGELRRARTETLALAAEAVLAGKKRPARTLPDDVADRKRAKFGDGADKDEKQNPVKRRDLPRTTNAPKETSRAAKPASEVVSVVASKLLRQPVVVIDEPARPRKVVVPTIRSESKHRDKTPDEGLEDEPACTIALAPVASTRTVSLDTLVQWSVDTEPTSDMESMLGRALRPVGQETAHPPRTVIVGGKNDSRDHHDEPHDVSCTSLVDFGCQSDVVPGNSVCCQTEKIPRRSVGCQGELPAATTRRSTDIERSYVGAGCQTKLSEALDTTQVADARMWARFRLVVDFIDQLSVSTDIAPPEVESEGSMVAVLPTESDLRARAYTALRWVRVTKRSLCILLVIAKELGLLVYTDVDGEGDWRAKIQIGVRATLRRMERRQRHQRVQILGEVERACLDVQFREDDLRTIVFGCLMMAPRRLPVVYTRRAARKPAPEDGMSTSSDEEFEVRRRPSARVDLSSAVGRILRSSKSGGNGEVEDNSSQLLSDETTAQ